MEGYQRTRSKPRYHKKADQSYSENSYASEPEDVGGYCSGDSQQYNSGSSSDDTAGRELDRRYKRRGEQLRKEVDDEAERGRREDEEEFGGYGFNQGNNQEKEEGLTSGRSGEGGRGE